MKNFAPHQLDDALQSSFPCTFRKDFEFQETLVLPKICSFLLSLDQNGSIPEQQGWCQRSLTWSQHWEEAASISTPPAKGAGISQEAALHKEAVALRGLSLSVPSLLATRPLLSGWPQTSLLCWILALLLLTYGVNMLIMVLLSVLFLSRCLCLAKAAFHVRMACAQNKLGWGPAKPVLQREILCRNIPTHSGPAACPKCPSSGSWS